MKTKTFSFILVFVSAAMFMFATSAQAPPVLLLEEDEEETVVQTPPVQQTVSEPTPAVQVQPDTPAVAEDDDDELVVEPSAKAKAAAAKAQAEAEAKAKAEEEAKAKAAEQARIEAEKKAKAEAEAKAKAEAEAKAKAEEEARLAAEKKAQEEAAAKAKAEAEAKAKAEEEARLAAEAKAQAEAEAKAKAEAEAKAAQEERERIAAAAATAATVSAAAQQPQQTQPADNSAAAQQNAELQKQIEELQKAVQTMSEALEEQKKNQNQNQQTQPNGGNITVIVGGQTPSQPVPVQHYNPVQYQQPQLQQQRQVATQPEAAPQPVEEPKKLTFLQRYYNYSGHTTLTWLGFSYGTFFYLYPPAGETATSQAFKRHLINFEIFEWRASLFGMSLFNFEMGLPIERGDPSGPLGWTHTDDYGSPIVPSQLWVAWKPSVKVFIPCAKCVAFNVYGGVEMDFSGLFAMMPTASDKNENNWYFGIHAGLAFMLTGIPQIPLEIKAEYRHPLPVVSPYDKTTMCNANLLPQGFYLSFQLSLTQKIKPKK